MNSVQSIRSEFLRINMFVVLFCGVLISARVSAQNSDPFAPFLGIWSGTLTTQESPYWYLEDFACFAGCSTVAYEHMTDLLDDPANAERTPREIMGMGLGFQAQHLTEVLTPFGREIQQANNQNNDPKLLCQPYGLVREVVNPLPLEITRKDDHLLIYYEEWSMLRRIYTDGREHPEHLIPRLLGHSVAHVENDELVVESALLTPDWITDFGSAGHTLDARVTERYRVLQDPKRLEVELTVTDPAVLTEPYVLRKTWLATPGIELHSDVCSAIPGQF